MIKVYKKERMRKFILWGGLLLFFISLLVGISWYDDIKIQENGTVIKMRIEKLPSSCLGTKINHYATLSYKGVKYIKQVGAGFVNNIMWANK